MKTLTTILALAASPLVAAPMATWQGAGPSACNNGPDVCDLEWAVSTLSESDQETLAQVRQHQPDPALYYVPDGARFTQMAYADDGVPRMDHGDRIATLDEPAPAHGWRIGDRYFVKMEACANWAVYTGETLTATGGYVRQPVQPVTVSANRAISPTPPTVYTFDPDVPVLFFDTETPVAYETEDPLVPAVGLLGSLWYLLLGLAAWPIYQKWKLYRFHRALGTSRFISFVRIWGSK